MEKILCIFCGQRADIVEQHSSDIVICRNCHRETEFDTYRNMLDEWLDEICQKGIIKERRSGKDRRLADDNLFIGTDKRSDLERRKL